MTLSPGRAAQAAFGNPASPTPAPSKAVAPPNTPGTATAGAQAQLTAQLVAWGMPAELAQWAWNTYKGLGVTSVNAALPTIIAEIPNQPAFKQRFPAYTKFAADGEAVKVADIISYERTAKEMFQAAGLPPGFYDTNDEIQNLMAQHVGTPELQNRVQQASAAALAAPDVRQQLESLFGLPDGHGALTAYYLNPQKALPAIQQQFQAAQIGAQGVRTGVGQLTPEQAMHLAQIGVTDAGAAQGFGQLGQQAGLFQQQVTGEQGIDLQTQLAATFDNSAAAQLRIAHARQQRLADFQGAAGENLTSTGVGGLGRVDRSAG